MVIRGVVFDLDDTLFLERDYVSSGFRAVSRLLATRGARSIDDYHAQLLELGQDPNSRGRVFDKLVRNEPQLASCVSIRDLVTTYRCHHPDITLLPGALDVLELISSANLSAGMITDGPVASQKAKLAALGLSQALGPIILTDGWGVEFRKPHERAFERIEELWRCVGDDLVYVGDNPLKDFIAPQRRGWLSVRIKHPNQLHGHTESRSPETSAAMEVKGFDELGELIQSWQD